MSEKLIFNPKNFSKSEPQTEEPKPMFKPGQIIETVDETVGVAPQRGPVKAWSASTLKKFENCPLSIYYGKVEKIKEKESTAADRGSKIHDLAEHYVDGTIGELPKELEKFKGKFEKLREQYIEGIVTLEQDWGFNLAWDPVGWMAKDVWARLKLDGFVEEGDTSAIVIDYKGLPVDTPIPTPEGWTTMGALKRGDKVFTRNGNITIVADKSKVKNIGVYELTFDDATTIQCDEEHIWWTVDGQELCVTDLAPGIAIPMANPLKLPEAELPIHPYVLGLWLAEGRKNGSEVTVNSEDAIHIMAKVKEAGYTLGKKQKQPKSSKCFSQTIKGIRGKLIELGMLEGKHIPDCYLRASISQRLELLQGFMDGDGSANPYRKQAVFNTTNEQLAKNIHELTLSLGQRATIRPFKGTGFGQLWDCYQVTFRPQHFNPFSLPRKAEKMKWDEWGPGRSDRRVIKKIKKVESTPTQCIAVESSCRSYLCGKQFAVTHNTGRKFGNEIDHNRQAMIYAIGAFMRFPNLEFIRTEFWYLDKGEELRNAYTRDQAMLFLPRLTKRAINLTSCIDFKPKPSRDSCRWCSYKDGPCEWGHEG